MRKPDHVVYKTASIQQHKAIQMIRDTEQTEAKQSFMKCKRRGKEQCRTAGEEKETTTRKELPSHRTMRLFTEVVCKQGFMLSMALLCLPRRATSRSKTDVFV